MNTNSDCSAQENLQGNAKGVEKRRICQLCRRIFHNDIKFHYLWINEPLPSSCLSSRRLLYLFEVSFLEPHSYSSDVATIKTCSGCYSLLMKADSVYRLLLSLSSQIRKTWMKRSKDDVMIGTKTRDSKSFVKHSTGVSGQSGSGGKAFVRLAKSGVSSNKEDFRLSSPSVNKSSVCVLPNPSLDVPEDRGPSGVKEVRMMTSSRVDELRTQQEDQLSQVQSKTKKYNCMLCGSCFDSERSWLLHFRRVHQIDEKWFDYDLQSALEYSLRKELEQNSKKPKDGKENSLPNLVEVIYKCSACQRGSYGSQKQFVDHLHNYHNLDIKKKFSSVTESTCKRIFPNPQERSSDVKVISKCDVVMQGETPSEVVSKSSVSMRYHVSLILTEVEEGMIMDARESCDGNDVVEDESWPGEGNRKCRFCGDMFEIPLELEKHEKAHEKNDALADKREDEVINDKITEGPSASETDKIEHEVDQQPLRTTEMVTIKVHSEGKGVDSEMCSICGDKFADNLLRLKHKANIDNMAYNIDKTSSMKWKNRKLTQEDKIEQVINVLKKYCCKLCGSNFDIERSWLLHFRTVHRIHEDWFDHNLQSDLQHSLRKVLEQNSIKLIDGKNTLSDDAQVIYKCSACNRMNYDSQKQFISHLHDYHNLGIKEDVNSVLGNSYTWTFPNPQEESCNSMGDVVKLKDGRASIRTTEEDVIMDTQEIDDGNDASEENFSGEGKRKYCSFSSELIETSVELMEHEETCDNFVTMAENEKDNKILNHQKTEKPDVSWTGTKESQISRKPFKAPKIATPDGNSDTKKTLRRVCNICGDKFPNNLLMLKHKRNIHGMGKNIVKKPLKKQCRMCSFRASTQREIIKHWQYEHVAFYEAKTKSKCKICGKSVGIEYLPKHISTVHEKKRYILCNHCPLRFRSLAWHTKHVKTHHSGKTWKCTLCEKEFSKSYQLRQHRYIHQKAVHLCSICGKGFKRKYDLLSHRKRNHMARVYISCMYCPQKYNERYTWRKHMFNKHDVPWEITLSKSRNLWKSNYILCEPQRKSSKQQQSTSSLLEEAEVDSRDSNSQQDQDEQVRAEDETTIESSLTHQQSLEIGYQSFTDCEKSVKYCHTVENVVTEAVENVAELGNVVSIMEEPYPLPP